MQMSNLVVFRYATSSLSRKKHKELHHSRALRNRSTYLFEIFDCSRTCQRRTKVALSGQRGADSNSRFELRPRTLAASQQNACPKSRYTKLFSGTTPSVRLWPCFNNRRDLHGKARGQKEVVFWICSRSRKVTAILGLVLSGHCTCYNICVFT